MTLTPADQGYQVQVLVDQIADLRAQVEVLKRIALVNAQRATVQSVPGGAMINVTFTATGSVQPVPYLLGYSPSVGHGGYVVDTGCTTLFIPVSAYL